MCKETTYQLSRIRNSVQEVKDLAKTDGLEPANGFQQLWGDRVWVGNRIVSAFLKWHQENGLNEGRLENERTVSLLFLIRVCTERTLERSSDTEAFILFNSCCPVSRVHCI